MALNPFHWFRKHQKVVFAGLTIICMLTFVMASGFSGRGDFFGEVSSWFGAQRKIPQVAKLYGKTVDIREINRLRAQRKIANEFIANALGYAFDKVKKDALKVQEFDKILQDQMQNLNWQRQLAMVFNQGTGQYVRAYEQLQRSLNIVLDRLAGQKKTEEQEKIRRLRVVLDKEHWLFLNRDELNPRSGLYFGGSTSLEGLLDFLIWSHEADRLGINLLPADIKTAVSRETMFLITPEDSELIQRNMRMDTQAAGISLLEALGQEFRVRLAQAALTGYDPTGMTQVPAVVTPDQLWDYYLKNRTQVSVKALPIPVSKFVSQVKDAPAQELQALYDKYKKAEYAPNRETPGFMQPRRIKVEWVKISPDSPYYRKQAQTLLVAQTAAMVSNPMLASAWTGALLREYESLTWGPSWYGLYPNRLTDPNFSLARYALAFYTYKDLNRPETVASTVALGASPFGLGGLSTVITIPCRAAARGTKDPAEANALAPAINQEAEQTVSFAGALLSAGTSVAPDLTAAAMALQADKIDRNLPLSLVAPQLLEEMENKLAGTLASNDRTSFKTELEKLKKDAEAKKTKFEAAAQAFVTKQLQQHQWEHGSSAGFASQYDIGRDPGLKLLREAYAAAHPEEANAEKRLGDQFFTDVKADPNKLYTPEDLRFGGDFLYWRTADQPPEVLPFDKVRDQVLAAWRLEKARPLAKAEAERIAQVAKKTKDPIPNLIEEAKGQKLIDIEGIARLSQQPSARMGFGGSYVTYAVPESKIEYPSLDFVSDVLELKQVGDVTVESNQPKTIYYVVAVTRRDEPSLSEFRDAQLLPQLEQERRLIYRRSILDHLRDQARLQIDEEGRKQGDERGTMSED
jgi:hypothetical protein